MYCILHISDLHRARTDPITNAELISALVSDRDRYLREDPPITPPQAIIVSGDIIQGVGLDHPAPDAELADQYRTAELFLDELCQRFLDSDRSRIVIVPGNHDIDWNKARSAMVPVKAEDYPANMPLALYEPGSLYRWNWKTRELLTIADLEGYNQRFAAFWRFFDTFYTGVPGLLRVAPWSDANLFSLDEGRIGVAAFNSCVGNDCFAFHGAISRDIVARSHLDLEELGTWRLRIAVWHHDIEGPPYRSDYMDPDIVRGMIGRGFRLGLYGHQHLAQVTPQHAHLPDRETMAVVSAGSLCAGREELPMGANRGYSLIEIADDHRHARVHVREMAFSNLFSRANLSAFGGRSYVDLEWTVPADSAGRPESPERVEIARRIRSAEAALVEQSDAVSAVALLKNTAAAADPFGRRLLLEAAESAGDWALVRELTAIPETIGELVLGIDAALKFEDFDLAEQILRDHADRVAADSATRAELTNKINALQRMNP